MDIFGISDNGE